MGKRAFTKKEVLQFPAQSPATWGPCVGVGKQAQLAKEGEKGIHADDIYIRTEGGKRDKKKKKNNPDKKKRPLIRGSTGVSNILLTVRCEGVELRVLKESTKTKGKPN